MRSPCQLQPALVVLQQFPIAELEQPQSHEVGSLSQLSPGRMTLHRWQLRPLLAMKIPLSELLPTVPRQTVLEEHHHGTCPGLHHQAHLGPQRWLKRHHRLTGGSLDLLRVGAKWRIQQGQTRPHQQVWRLGVLSKSKEKFNQGASQGLRSGVLMHPRRHFIQVICLAQHKICRRALMAAPTI